jgi:dephospho-CoA kinase
MILLGLTGGIGMGKSTVAKMFASHGIPSFNADAAVHKLQAPNGRAIPTLDAAFPGVVHDGVLDRAALRARVLTNNAEMKKLEAIIHPMVRDMEAEFMATARQESRQAVLLDIPLLFEGGGESRVSKTIVVSCPRALQIQRVLALGLPLADIESIIARQMPDAEKRHRADYIVDTSGTLEDTAFQVAHIIKELKI